MPARDRRTSTRYQASARGMERWRSKAMAEESRESTVVSWEASLGEFFEGSSRLLRHRSSGQGKAQAAGGGPTGALEELPCAQHVPRASDEDVTGAKVPSRPESRFSRNGSAL